MNTTLATALGWIFVLCAFSCPGSLVVADDFDRPDSQVLGSTPFGGFAWVKQETAIGSLTINGSQMVAGSTTAGRDYGLIDLSSAPMYSTTLANNSGLVTWAINMQQSRSNPSGFDASNYGLGFILATDTAILDSDVSPAKGYAVVLGQSGETDAIRLVSFSGLKLNSTLTDVISGGDFGSEHLNIRVTYDPTGNTWSLYASSGTTFSDPNSTSTQIGSTVHDSTYTSESLNYAGVIWKHSTASDNAVFDNFSLTVVPEPAEWGALFGFGLFGILGFQVWRERRAAMHASKA